MERASIIDIAIECLLAGDTDRDPEERHHCRRVERLCAMTAKELGWTPDEVQDLRLAALLHHMDRKRVPESALAPKVAAYLSRFNEHAAEPENRTRVSCGREQEAASIIAVSDAFDRLTSPQSYRRPLTESEAVQILQYDAAGSFDRPVVEAFCRAYTIGHLTQADNAA